MQSFSNTRIVYLTQAIAGLFQIVQLALLDADVIENETPESPDTTCHDGHDLEHEARAMGAIFITLNTKKRPISMDLKSLRNAEDTHIARSLKAVLS